MKSYVRRIAKDNDSRTIKEGYLNKSFPFISGNWYFSDVERVDTQNEIIHVYIQILDIDIFVVIYTCVT